MHEITPHMTCVVYEHEFNDDVKQRYGEVYILTPKGILKHIRLSRGRHVRIVVDSIPGYNQETSLREDINFLPAGKVPHTLLEEIVQFFKDVMNIKKAEQEAMAHILWNETEGYHIGIPNQTVSKASVNYEFDHIKAGDIIVVDIHSHNTMGAFFSGTDNSDDRRMIGYSGVVGKLDEPTPMFVWRFNNNDIKTNATISDIFEVPHVDIETPKEWLEKVKTGVSFSGKGSPVVPYRFYQGGPTGGSYPRRSENDWKNRSSNFPHGGGGIDDLWDGQSDIWEGMGGYPGGFPDERIPDQNFADKGIVISPKEANARGKEIHIDEGEFDYHAAQYGKEAAEAVIQIKAWLEDLEGQDELLTDIFQQAFELMSTQGQTKIMTNGLR